MWSAPDQADRNGSAARWTGPARKLRRVDRQDQLVGDRGAKDLILGLDHPTSTGTGSIGFSVSIDGANVVSQGFSSLAAASAYFTNHALDLGAVSTYAAAGPITVGVTLQEQVVTNSGLFAGLLLGTSHM